MGFLKGMARNCARKARNSANQAAYIVMWGEEPPKGKKKTGKKKKEDK